MEQADSAELWPLTVRCSLFLFSWSLGPLFPWSLLLKNSVLSEGGFRRHAFFESFADGFLLARFLKGAGEDLLLDGAGNNADSIEIAEDNVSGDDARLADLNGNTVVDDLAARALILGIAAARKRRKAQRKDAARVARVAIDNSAGRAAFAGAHTHQLAPERVTRRCAGADVEFVELQVV